MAYLLTHFWPGDRGEQYRATLAPVTEAGDGSRGEKFHAAGPTEDAFLIVGVQDSKDAAESFLHNTLMPLTPIEGGLVGPPEERSAEIVNSEGLSA